MMNLLTDTDDKIRSCIAALRHVNELCCDPSSDSEQFNDPPKAHEIFDWSHINHRHKYSDCQINTQDFRNVRICSSAL